MKNKKEEIKQAAALKYEPEIDSAPKLIALGKGEIAKAIINKAIEKGIHIEENPELAKILNMLNIGDEIPTELYDIVASILLFIGDLDKLS